MTLTPEESFYLHETTGMMSPAAIKWLIETAAGVSSWTEVGVYCGRSALAVGLALPSEGLLQLVDIRLHPRLYPNLDWLCTARPSLKIVLCRMSSADAAQCCRDTDGVFVDDCHKYPAVRASILAWKDKCVKLCGHDYSRLPDSPHAGVRQAVDELCENVQLVPNTSIWVRAER